MAGLLQITVKGCTGPQPSPEGHAPSSTDGQQCSISVGDSVHLFKCLSGPNSQETCTLFVRDIQQQYLSVRMMAGKSTWLPASSQADNHLGSAVQHLDQICDGQRHEVDLVLRGGQQHSGENRSTESTSGVTMRLDCRFLPFTDVLAADAAISEMGGPVVSTPGQIPLAAEWQEVLELAEVASHAMLTPVAYVEHAGSNTQAWVYWNRAQHILCVAFRGTEQGKWRDILTDLHLVPAPLDPGRAASAPRRAALAEVSQPPDEPSRLRKVLAAVDVAKQQRKEMQEEGPEDIVAAAISTVRTTAQELQDVLQRVRQELEAGTDQIDTDQPWVHTGFLTAYDSVRPAVLSVLTRMLEGEEAPWRLYNTGHSLGGALATLCAWDCSHRRWPCQQQPELAVYNFGTPRVGNRAFADNYNTRVPCTWRIVNDRDTVCTVPRLMGYAHVGHAVHLRDGQAEVELHTTERLGEGVGIPDVAPAVGAAVQATVIAKVPELLPAAAVEVLEKVGIEVATGGDEEAAMAVVGETRGGSAVSGPGSGQGAAGGEEGEASAAAAVVAPEQLSDLWEEELSAWKMLLDGSALDDHMEPLYLRNLKAYLHAAAKKEHDTKGSGSGTDSSSCDDPGSSAPMREADGYIALTDVNGQASGAADEPFQR